MKHLVGKTINTDIVEQGLLYTIITGDYAVEILNSTVSSYEVTITPANSNNIIIDSVPFQTLIEAVQNADEMIEELLLPDDPIDKMNDWEICPPLVR